MPQQDIRNEANDFLMDALMSLENREEGYACLEDLMTRRELEDLSQRLQVAKMLRGGFTYTEITAKTGASSATIGRVNRALTYGADGYNTVLDRLDGKNK